jgi:hypothetical protein
MILSRLMPLGLCKAPLVDIWCLPSEAQWADVGNGIGKDDHVHYPYLGKIKRLSLN